MSSGKEKFPWKKIFFVVVFVFFTGLSYLFQEFGIYFLGSIIGEQKSLLSEYACPQANFAFETSPIPGLFSYVKGDGEENRKELLRINKKNYGLTAWLSYDKGFEEAAKASLIDLIAYERNPNQYLVNLYQNIKNDGSPHAAVDFVTKWLSPDNVHLPTVYPYTAGMVVDSVNGNIGYGNYVSVCSDLTDSSGKKLRVLYNVAHLDSLSVTEGQIVKAGDELGKIGSTGKSTTPHAHITIMPDLFWMSHYRDVYNAGYKFYYPTSVREILVKTIDPLSVLLNPEMAYSIVLDENKRKSIFDNAEQYIGSLGNTVAFEGASIILPPVENTPLPPPPSRILSSFRMSASSNQWKVGEWAPVSIEALDQEGLISGNFSEELKIVLSVPTAKFTGLTRLQNGTLSLQVTNTVPGEIIIQVSNFGSISQEMKIFFEAIEEIAVPVKEVVKPTQIVFLEGKNYLVHEKERNTLITFQESSVTSDYPVEIQFTVPKESTAVSIFSGIGPKAFPESGELKLSKFTPGQEFVRYYPKYPGQEESYKKIVAYQDGEKIDERIFTWSPASLHIFSDVVKGYTEKEIYAAVKALKGSGVVKGNPDGSFGVDSPLNRAAAATLLIRAFYSDVNLEGLTVTRIKFKDVPKTAWFAPPIWFASERQYEGEEKPVILKGSKGYAYPDGNVKLEEFVTMILRILEVPLVKTNPWYEGALKKSIELKLISEAERSFIDQALPRGLVARILVQALQIQSGVVSEPLQDQPIIHQDTALIPSLPPVSASPTASIPAPISLIPALVLISNPVISNPRFELSSDRQLKLQWDSNIQTVFHVKVQYGDDGVEEFAGSTSFNHLNFGLFLSGLKKPAIFRIEAESFSHLPRAEIRIFE